MKIKLVKLLTISVQIGNYIIDKDSEPFIIAEVGINHNGEIDKAFQMIKVAKDVGCDAIKFQTYKTEEFITDKSLTYQYISQGKEITESQFEMFKRYEFTKYQWYKIKAYCDRQNIMFLSTPQNVSDLKLLLTLEIPTIKVGSDDFTNTYLLKQYEKTKLPIILSCGMSYLHEIHNVLNIFENNYPLILMLCTSQYPTPYKDVNIFKLQTLKEWFGHKVILGFSDHTQSSLSASMAVALGARVFEKHFTLSNALPGPDHCFSENPNGLMKWVNTIKGCYKILGSSEVKPTDKEKEMRKIARRSIVALKDISVGEKLTVDNIGLHRPGIGIPAEKYESLLGSFVLNKIHKGKLIEEDDFY